jgi:putative Mg2+ transporter-C (MgtC) family protein
MQAAVNQGEWAMRLLPDENLVTDPTRMAHGILTGIGFLCAGVIFRTGFSIHGLTSAASLWITSALGVIFGAGMYQLGTQGVIVTLLILAVLRLVSLRLPARGVIDAEVAWRRDGDSPMAEVEKALRDLDAHVQHTRFEMTHDGHTLRQHWKLKVRGSRNLEALSARLAAMPAVTAYVLSPRDD